MPQCFSGHLHSGDQELSGGDLPLCSSWQNCITNDKYRLLTTNRTTPPQHWSQYYTHTLAPKNLIPWIWDAYTPSACWTPLYSFLRAATANHHKLDGLTQQKFTLSEFNPKVQNQGGNAEGSSLGSSWLLMAPENACHFWACSSATHLCSSFTWPSSPWILCSPYKNTEHGI